MDGRDQPEPWARGMPGFLSYRIVRLHHALNAQGSELLARSAGITLGQWRVILMAGSGEGPTARDISRKVAMDPALVSRNLRALERDGLVATSRPDDDRRVLSVALTDAGRALYERTLPMMQARQKALLESLDRDEQAVVFGILDKLEIAAARREFEPMADAEERR